MVKDLHIWRLSRTIWVDPKGNKKCPYKGEVGGNFTVRREEGNVIIEAENGEAFTNPEMLLTSSIQKQGVILP